MDVSIICERWFSPNGATLSLDCGRFWIDSIDFEMPQNTVSVKASSLPTDEHLKSGKETRGWENSNLKDIATQIAGENNMEVDWQCELNPKYKRVEQDGENGLRFLKHRANDAKLSIKVCRNKLIFFDEEKLESEGPKFTLAYGNATGTYRMTGGHFATKITDTKKKAKVKYVNPETGKLNEEEAAAGDTDGEDREDNENINPDIDPDEGDGGGAMARVGEGLSDWKDSDTTSSGSAAGQRKAKSILRDANKEKETASVELSIGNPLIAAGQTFQLVGVGQFDGKWFITSASHKVAPKYETTLNIRRCLEGY
jgi:phage protein D